MKSLLFALCLMCSFSLYAKKGKDPHVVDFSHLKPRCDYGYDRVLWKSGQYAFNGAPELGSFIVYLKKLYDIHTVVESGTFKGCTTTYFAQLFETVHTIEIMESTFKETQKHLSFAPHVTCHLGSSDAVFKTLLPSLKGEMTLFYLDAHWQNHWPLLSELETISQTHKDNCVIIIDDFKVPGRKDIDYDKYNNDECTYEYIQEKLDKIFTHYEYHYLIPKNPQCRAKFVAYPKP
ncbi:MAG: class I SAM-dependent methyltransferase [Simkaniaceae bacterium]